jgi:hypothetical protein
MAERTPCPYCDATFGDQNAVYQHAKVKHSKRKARALRPERTSEPSLAEELIEAQVAWEMHRTAPPTYLKLMFPEAFQ